MNKSDPPQKPKSERGYGPALRPVKIGEVCVRAVARAVGGRRGQGLRLVQAAFLFSARSLRACGCVNATRSCFSVALAVGIAPPLANVENHVP